MKPDTATQRQIDSADPRASTWLSANAGSGKTRVLTDRVARLLLEGVSPQNILCLTYTKAAASEMENRLFSRLGVWSMLDDADLSKALSSLGNQKSFDQDELAHARTLFARALETPGGLRIQTIHSFCASLLRRFPLEARISPVFREMEERAATAMRNEIVEEMARGEDAAAVAGLARYFSGESFSSFVAEIARQGSALLHPDPRDFIWTQFDLAPEFDEAQLLNAVFQGKEAALFDALIPILHASEKPTDQKTARRLAAIDVRNPSLEGLTALFQVFLFGAKAKSPYGAKIGSLPTKDVRCDHPKLIEELQDFMMRVEMAREPFNRLYSAQRTLALYEFAARFLPRYEAEKAARAWLDFDDLIDRAISLLSDPEVAQWVLYRLDGGLDHILVDEAQDTSPQQWRVIELLAQEFASGLGARPGSQRTIFVVGDLKQSIYSFQGADPDEFERMRRHFSDSVTNAGLPFHERSLDHSFRSSPAILEFVDITFELAGGKGLGGAPNHLAFHASMPGRVDHWPSVPASDGPEEKKWYDPVDTVAANDPRVVLAEKIAGFIAGALESESIPDEKGEFRTVSPGDFLILVQRRSELFHEIIRACKARGLPIAGADRLKIGAELAVKDLIALLSFLSVQDDDLSLASALRSPLFGLSEDDIFMLAHDRGKSSLWEALLRSEASFPEAVSVLADLRNRVDFLRPFELLELILTRFSGRERMLARLGPEAEDGIDALLSQAIAYEHAETPSLTGFLVWMAADEIDLKRKVDSAGGRIRVMTTHGAKGLESPIVILPDTGDWSPRHRSEFIEGANGFKMWKSPAERQPAAMAAALAQANEAQSEERMRLLYVALTRAEKWLILCGAGEIKESGTSWYQLTKAGIEAVGGQPVDTPTGTGLRHQHGNWLPAPAATSTEPGASAAPEIPGWVSTRAPLPAVEAGLLTPSDMGGAKALFDIGEGLNEAEAMLRGTRIHRLLEHLPRFDADQWPHVAKQLLSADGSPLTDEDIASILAEAEAVLTSSAFADVFAPGTLAEVDVTAELPEFAPKRMRGTIDRLIVTPESARVIDFKSNRMIPESAAEVPVGILRQMGVYLGAIKQIYPDLTVELAVLWTAGPKLMIIPNELAAASLVAGAALDLGEAEP